MAFINIAKKIKNIKLKLFLREKAFNPLFEYFANFFNENNSKKNFLTYHLRPIFAENFRLRSDILKCESKTAIIVQGKIVSENDFTLETIRIYKKIFPSAIIILSLREGADEEAEIAKIKNENIVIIFHKTPDTFGPGNINLQILSSVNGMKKAKELGAEYAIKTRTDQRIYAPNSLSFLKNTLKVFPLQQSIIQKSRIIGVSLNTYKYRPYSLSDMTTFGHIDDMLLYWDANLDNRTIDTMRLTKSIDVFTQGRICEVYLVTEFLKKIGHEPKMNISDWWLTLNKYFCVVDQTNLDLFWYKYHRHTEYKILTYDKVVSTQQITFNEWLNIYIDLENKSKISEENIMSKTFGAVIDKN